MRKLAAAVVATLGVMVALFAFAAAPRVTLRGSPASMERQHEVAVAEDYTFVKDSQEVEDLVSKGRLVRVTGGPDYTLARVSYPYARREVLAMVERVAADHRRACGEPLVVTSLTRPQEQQPGNAHALSVHPAGMAADFRISRTARCRKWLEKTLLALERQQVVDVTRERRPPHYHVAVFPDAWTAYAAREPEREEKAAPTRSGGQATDGGGEGAIERATEAPGEAPPGDRPGSRPGVWAMYGLLLLACIAWVRAMARVR